uniref:Uncharacterized protein n=1 Tax=Romanomermis culicivorax TaxID=13658 RepID=A0A915IYB1_ROMCU
MKNNENIKLNMYNNKYLQCTKTNTYSIQQQICTTTGPTTIKTPKTLFESSFLHKPPIEESTSDDEDEDLFKLRIPPPLIDESEDVG